MPELGTSGSVRGRDGQPPGLLDLQRYRKAKREGATLVAYWHPWLHGMTALLYFALPTLVLKIDILWLQHL